MYGQSPNTPMYTVFSYVLWLHTTYNKTHGYMMTEALSGIL